MEEPKLEIKHLDLWSGPCSMGSNGYLFSPLRLKCERIYSNGNKRLQELVVILSLIMIGTITLPGLVKHSAVISLMWY